jgi:hypothetical protein
VGGSKGEFEAVRGLIGKPSPCLFGDCRGRFGRAGCLLGGFGADQFFPFHGRRRLTPQPRHAACRPLVDSLYIGLLTSSGAPAGTGYRSTTNNMVSPVYWRAP